jgi:hypothetical protein
VAAKRWRLRKLLSLLGAIAFVAAFYKYGLAVSRGAIPTWVDALVTCAWVLVVVVGILALVPLDERRLVGDLRGAHFSLRPSERQLFRRRFMSGALYRPADKFDPCPTLRQWFLGGGVYIRGLLQVDLTTERLAFGRVAGPTYRVLPLADIERWSEVEGRWPYRRAVYIEYLYAGQSEGILVWTKSRNGRRFKQALQEGLPGRRPAAD